MEKVALFQSVFRGRTDVFPKRWENRKSGKAGYSPACSNDWVRGICGKPQIKCSECPNQAFIPLGEQTILDHLRGKFTAGVYPLLPDDTNSRTMPVETGQSPRTSLARWNWVGRRLF
jgi:hypothetical protein